MSLCELPPFALDSTALTEDLFVVKALCCRMAVKLLIELALY
jgi:hypothetical protein